MIKNLGFGLIILISGLSAYAVQPKTGHWQAFFKLNEVNILRIDLTYNSANGGEITFYNGEEKISLNDLKLNDDSLFVSFKTFSSEFKCEILNKTYLQGKWYNKAKSENYSIDFWAIYNKKNLPRYESVEFNNDLFGRWEVTFDYLKDPEKAVGIFIHSQSKINAATNIAHGTFLTETGDYRFLEGAATNDSLYLSCFDGSHVFLFSALLKQDTLWGEFLSGTHYKTNWYAVKNELFELRHPDSLTYLVDQSPIQFELPNIDGTTYSYPNKDIQGKVVLIQLMGTWCPNCLDESIYLKTIYDNHKSNLDIIAVTFETQKTLDTKIEKVSAYKNALQLDYTFLIGGDACKKCASQLFPQLNNIMSFPTLILIDKKGEIRKIHTGFSGPGTGEYYTEFVESTNVFIDQLLAE